MNEPSRIITPAPARTYQAPQLQSDGSDASTLMQVISRAATDPNFDIEKMERLLTMHERIRGQQAMAAYQDALAQMQPELPIIGERGGIKDKAGNIQSKYALWEDIVGQITPVLSRHGFAISFRTSNDAKEATVTAVLMHKQGHREESPMTLPMDTSGSKNAVQAVGSSISYGKRYTASALLNLRTGEVDNDGQTERPELPLDVQTALEDAAKVGSEALANCFRGLSETTRARIVADYNEEWKQLKAVAAKVGK
jgi:hypothetical protein